MAGTTAVYGFPYPTGTDSINTGDTAIQSLAQKIEDLLDTSPNAGGLFRYYNSDDSNNRTTINCSSTPKNVTSGVALNFTNGKSGFFAVIITGNANNTTTAANGWAFGATVTGGSVTANDVQLSTDLAGTGRGGGASIQFYTATAGASMTVTPRVRTILAGGADTIIVYQSRIQVVTFG